MVPSRANPPLGACFSNTASCTLAFLRAEHEDEHRRENEGRCKYGRDDGAPFDSFVKAGPDKISIALVVFEDISYLPIGLIRHQKPLLEMEDWDPSLQ